MVGLYETVIDMLCSAKGRKPKIIASTATIRRAAEQCKALYAREVRQFPSPGLDANDSFFAREAALTDDTPGRLYVGVMSSGKTSTTMQVRLMANLIQAVNVLNAPDEVKDKFWTQVVYCNSIRELGSSKSIIYDDVKGYSSTLSERHGVRARYYKDTAVEELTSRVPAESIPEILERLTVEYPSDQAIGVLLATNMISVGVDIDRLGLMMVLGQPKTTSEYIQATSRVGRKYPGLVFTLFSPVKSRDRSHYEQFVEYHQSLYRRVEPTSVTPFSAPVRDKALHAVVITLVRHLLGLHENADLKKFDAHDKKLENLIDLVLERVEVIDPAEKQSTRTEIEKIIGTISEIAEVEESGYFLGPKKKTGAALLKRPHEDRRAGYYSTPQSMRSTDAECYISIDYS